MTLPGKKDPPKPQPPSAGSAAGMLECAAAVLAGVAIALRPVLPGHALEFSKTLLLHGLVLAAGLLWLAGQCLAGRIRMGRSGVGIPLVAYALVIAVSPVFAAYKYASLQSLPVWLTNLLLCFIVFSLSRHSRARGFFLAVLLASAAVVIFQGIYQRAEGLEELRRLAEKTGFLDRFASPVERELATMRLEGNEPFASFATSNMLATFLLITVPVLLGAGMESLRGFTRLGSFLRSAALFAAAGAGLACLLFTGSLAARVVFAAEAVIFILILFRRRIAARRLACAVAVAALALAVFGPPYIRRLAETRSVNYRLGYWTGAWGVFRENWLTGVGLENFRWSYTAHKPAWAGEVAYPHNSVIQSAAEFGVAGLAAYAAFWALFIRRVLRTEPAEAVVEAERLEPDIMNRARLLLGGGAALTALFGAIVMEQPFASFSTSFAKGMLTAAAAAVIWAAVFAACAFARPGGQYLHAALATGALGFLLHSLFDFGIYSYGVNQALWVSVALALAAGVGGVTGASARPMSPVTRLALILLGCGVFVFYLMGPVAASLREGAALQKARDEGDVQALESAAEINPLNAETRRDLGMRYFHLWRGADRGSAALALGQMREASRLNPLDFAPHIETGIILREIGMKEEALAEYDRAIELYPTRPSLRVYRAELLDEAGRREDARRDIEEAARLLGENLMPDGTVRHTNLELDTVKGPGFGSEKQIYDALRSKYGADN